MIDVKFPIKVKDLAKVVDQANVNPHTMNDNKLIAEFMEVVFHDDENQYYSADGLHIGNTLQYHTSWDWLMPVVEKIKDMGYDHELDKIDNVLTCDLRQENLYNAVVEFIKEFN